MKSTALHRSFAALPLLAGLAAAWAFVVPRAESAALIAPADATALLGNSPEISVPFSFSRDPGTPVSALQIDLEFDPVQFQLTGLDLGSAAMSAGKQFSYAVLGDGSVRILVYGFNQIEIQSGVLILGNFRPASSASAGPSFLRIRNPAASSPGAAPAALAGGDSQITLFSPGAASTLNQARAYPNPFQPFAGHTRIWFGPLTEEARIQIYSLRGERIRVLDHRGGGLAPWDGKNHAGLDCASGVWLYAITNPAGERKQGKLVIIR